MTTAAPAELQSILGQLKKVSRAGDGWIARCPAHKDGRPSLSVTKGRDGRILFNCFAGCESSAIASALGLMMSDLFPEKLNGKARGLEGPVPHPELAETYPYVDEDGQLLYEVCRYTRAGGEKDFRQRRPDGRGGWIWNLDGVRRVLYQLPDVLEAVALEKTIYLVEGEKDAHAAAKLGLVATTNAGGAGKWRDDYSETLRGADVVVLPDNDEPGRKHALVVSDALCGVAASVRVVELPGVPEKGDLSDWIATGGTRAQLEALADAEPSGPEPRFVLIRASDMPSEPPPWLVDCVLFCASLVMLFAPPESFKSFIAVTLACCIASGRSFAGCAVRRGPVVYVCAEGGFLIRRRVEAWCAATGEDIADLDLCFLPEPLPLSDPTAITALESAIAALELDAAPSLVVLDTLAECTAGANENAVEEMQPLLNVARDLTKSIGATVLLVHHTNAGGERERGSTALRGSADTIWKAERDGENVLLRCDKMRDAAHHPDLRFQAQATGGSLALLTADPVTAVTLTESQRNILTVLSRCEPGESISPSEWRIAAGAAERTFFDARTALVTRGYVDRVGTMHRPRYRLSELGLMFLAADTAEQLRETNPQPAATLRGGSPLLGSPAAAVTAGGFETELDLEPADTSNNAQRRVGSLSRRRKQGTVDNSDASGGGVS